MTKEQKMQAYKMLLDGCTAEEVGNKFGITRQRVCQLFPIKKLRKEMASESCIFPNISKWMEQNDYGYTDIAKMCDFQVHKIQYSLKNDANITKLLIDRLLKITGMTYEEAFYRPTDKTGG